MAGANRPGGKTYVYIPFPRGNSQEHVNSTIGGIVQIDERDPTLGTVNVSGWNGITSGKVICSDDAQRLTKLAKLHLNIDVLYIRGHGEPGRDLLQSSDRAVTVTSADVVTQLSANGSGLGIPLGFQGMIKVFACHSGVSTGAAWWKEFSFAQRLADAMYAAGYQSCRFFGYTEELRTITYQSIYDSSGIPLNALSFAHIGSVSHKVGKSLARAHTVRVEVIPSQKQKSKNPFASLLKF